MEFIDTSDKINLYNKIKHLLGYPLRPFEITDEMMDSYFEIAIEDYSAIVNEWLIEQKWINLEGLDKSDGDFFNAYISKTNRYIESFTYAYSKQVGLGANAPASNGWELKRDYITISSDTQHYIIPKNREINEVLWATPPEINSGVIDPFTLNSWSAGMSGWSYLGRPAMYVQPTYSTLLAAQDRKTKQHVLQSTLSYKITGLESGEKLLHLYPIPGSKNEISNSLGKHFEGSKVWYWYYDINGNRTECLEANKDIIRLPSDPPTEILKWNNINDVAKKHIRDFLISTVKITIGGIRGFYSGELGVTEKQLTMDYRHLLDEGLKLKEDTIKDITIQLNNLTQLKLTEDRSKIAENVNIERGYQPFSKPIMVF